MLVLRLVTVLVPFLWFSQAQAAPILPNIGLEEILQIYVLKLNDLHLTIKDYAFRFMLFAGVLYLLLMGYTFIFKRDTPIIDFIGNMAGFLVILGITYFFILNGYSISRDILNSFTMIPFIGTGSWNNQVSSIFNDFFQLVESFTQILVTKTSLVFVVFLFINYLLLSVFLLRFLLTYMTALFVALAGIFFVSFAVLKVTRVLARNYFFSLIGYGMEMLTLCFIFNVGHSALSAMIVAMQNQIAQGQIIRLQEIGMTTFVMSLIVTLAVFLPKHARALTKN